MRTFLRFIIHNLEAGQAVCLVTLLTASGSTPRSAGALMALSSDGTCVGSIGGGNVEYAAQREGRTLLARQTDGLRSYRFSPDAALGMVCGGDVTVHFQSLTPEVETISTFRRLLDATAEDADVWLVRHLTESPIRLSAVKRDDGTDPVLLQERAVYRDGWSAIPIVQAGRVYVFGGGHVSEALVPILARTGFRVVVCDDRPEFSAPERFPDAEITLCCSYEQLSVSITDRDYAVILTRGHSGDLAILRQVLRSGAKYLGCIGSRAKAAHCREQLLALGFTDEEYRQVHTPIGLAIGAETPAEIAVSIAAELIAIRAGAGDFR